MKCLFYWASCRYCFELMLAWPFSSICKTDNISNCAAQCWQPGLWKGWNQTQEHWHEQAKQHTGHRVWLASVKGPWRQHTPLLYSKELTPFQPQRVLFPLAPKKVFRTIGTLWNFVLHNVSSDATWKAVIISAASIQAAPPNKTRGINSEIYRCWPMTQSSTTSQGQIDWRVVPTLLLFFLLSRFEVCMAIFQMNQTCI